MAATLMQIGDTVRLRSGGPEMTINDQSQLTGGWLCVWFNETAQLYEAWFGADAVVLARTPLKLSKPKKDKPAAPG